MPIDLETVVAPATCCVFVNEEFAGTGWLASPNGLIVTAGHFLEMDSICRVEFPDGYQSDAIVEDWKRDKSINVDFGILRIAQADIPVAALPGVSVLQVQGEFYSRGYGEVLKKQSTAEGSFLGGVDDETQRLFQLDSKQLGPGFSGAPIFSVQLQAVVGIQIETTVPDVGPERDTHLAMPLARIAEACERSVPSLRQIWPDRYALVRNRFEEWQRKRADSLARSSFRVRRRTVLPPLQRHWEKFLFGIEWHAEMKERVEAIRKLAAHSTVDSRKCPTLDTITSNIKSVKWNTRYDVLNDALREFSERSLGSVSDTLRTLKNATGDSAQTAKLRAQAHELHRKLLDLQERTGSPQYKRCFCVMGPLGSGKTHFVNALLAGEILEHPCPGASKSDIAEAASFKNQAAQTYVLALTPNANETLESTILRSLREATAQEWSSLSEFDATVSAHGPDARVLIAIDDLHQQIRTRTSGPFLSELLELIKGYTELRTVYWLLTMSTTEYYQVAARGAEWREYAFPITAHQSMHVATISGWIPLELLNEHDCLGLEIIRRHSLVASDSETRPADVVSAELLPERQSLNDLARSPFLAWLLIDLRKMLPIPIESMVGMRFVQVVVELGRHVLSHALRQAEQRGSMTATTIPRLVQAIYFLSEVWLGSSRQEHKYDEIVKALVDRGRAGGFELQREDEIRSTIELLQETGLLAIDKTRDELSMPRLAVSFPLEVFWECAVAVQFLHQNLAAFSSGDPATLVNELRQQIKRRNTQKSEGILEFVLLLVDLLIPPDARSETPNWPPASMETDVWSFDSLQQSARTRPSFATYAKAVWKTCLDESALSTATVYFAAPKSNVAIQNSVLEHSGVVRKTSDARTIFAYLYFLTEGTHAGDASLPFRLVRKLFEAVRTHSLGDYFAYFAARQLQKPESSGELLKTLMRIQGCEVMEIQEKLAKAAADRFKHVSPDGADRLNALLEYVKTTGKKRDDGTGRKRKGKRKRKDKAMTSRGDEGWRRHGFREWLLHFVCTDVVRLMMVDAAYHLFCTCGWYNADKQWNLSRGAAMELEREANIALGSLFYWYKYSPEARMVDGLPGDERLDAYFVRFVAELGNEASIRDRSNALHIIRHTVPTSGRRGVAVDDAFEPTLRKLSADRKLLDRLGGFREMFVINVEGFQ